jgi:hypothetical protein
MEVLPRDSLPTKIRWSQRAVARHLCSDKATVKVYAEQVAPVVLDYLKECPRNPDGSVKSGMSLSQYQTWVVCQLITLSRAIKNDLNGTPYRKIVKSTAIKQAHLLSKAAWEAQSAHVQSA